MSNSIHNREGCVPDIQSLLLFEPMHVASKGAGRTKSPLTRLPSGTVLAETDLSLLCPDLPWYIPEALV